MNTPYRPFQKRACGRCHFERSCVWRVLCSLSEATNTHVLGCEDGTLDCDFVNIGKVYTWQACNCTRLAVGSFFFFFFSLLTFSYSHTSSAYQSYARALLLFSEKCEKKKKTSRLVFVRGLYRPFQKRACGRCHFERSCVWRVLCSLSEATNTHVLGCEDGTLDCDFVN
ncbi:MAG: hypothetical protein O7C59_01635, partial [Rickettsia endosymbiont of Ixodes persulcatus]|nr:hypothetical protein [Rickettsia endosymbiont of Ixodes persulcatus]